MNLASAPSHRKIPRYGPILSVHKLRAPESWCVSREGDDGPAFAIVEKASLNSSKKGRGSLRRERTPSGENRTVVIRAQLASVASEPASATEGASSALP